LLMRPSAHATAAKATKPSAGIPVLMRRTI
jgi:hypothetical protein